MDETAMTPDSVLDIGQRALEVTTLLAGVILMPALMVGLVVAMFQAATQINEMTLTFIPKLIIVVVVLMLAGPWMLQLITDFTIELIESIPELIG
jgi:flagellar biosynthesis protein FliQ